MINNKEHTVAWQQELRTLENREAWDQAIELLKQTIAQIPLCMDAYMNMNYVLMNLLVDENEDENETSNFSSYEKMAKKYFKESFAKFSDNPEYLFFTGVTASMAESYFDIDTKQVQQMFQKAMQLEPESILYRWGYCAYVDIESKESQAKSSEYTKVITQVKSPIKAMLLTKGSLGEYVLEMMEC